MSEDRKCCPIVAIEIELGIIIVLLSVILIKCCVCKVDDDEKCCKCKKDKKDDKCKKDDKDDKCKKEDQDNCNCNKWW